MGWFSSTRTKETINNEIDALTAELDGFGDNGDDTNQSQDINPKITIEIFGSEQPNSKGFYINDYKIKTHKLDNTFSANDQVKYFFTNLIGAIENDNLPPDEQKDKSNFFHKYTKHVDLDPKAKEEEKGEEKGEEKEEEKEKEAVGGGKKNKRSRKRKPKSKHHKTRKH